MGRPLHDPNVIRAKGRRLAAWCNKAVHDAPWIDGDESTRGGLTVALALAEQAYRAHRLPYAPGFSQMHVYDPRRFTWIHDRHCDPKSCVKVRDERTGLTVVWRWV